MKTCVSHPLGGACPDARGEGILAKLFRPYLTETLILTFMAPFAGTEIQNLNSLGNSYTARVISPMGVKDEMVILAFPFSNLIGF